MESSVASLSASDEIRPYKIHVSSKYLELTQKKLELTRLPHELLLPKSREWEHGTPKSEIEPLIDFWLEQYSWRDQESYLNATLPQFRTAIHTDGGGVPLRIHFIHARSPHANAIPLLLIPPFPFTNFSLAKLIGPLTEPDDSTSTQPFHLVIPSIPGLGFSDSFTALGDGHISVLEQTAEAFNKLMTRLNYVSYVASATGSGADSPAGIDNHLARLMVERWSENCVGVHLINPLLERPRFKSQPLGWMKFILASFFHAPIFGYSVEDFAAMRESAKVVEARKTTQLAKGSKMGVTGNVWGAVGIVGLREPNTFAYALCDSPVGLLSLVCSALKKASPEHKLNETEIINVTQMAWLPGPEAGMRIWASAACEVENLESKRSVKPSIAVTVFTNDGNDGYVCPAWASAKHNSVFAQRLQGTAGLLAWEKPEVVVEGVRGLSKELIKRDARLRVSPLEEVIVEQLGDEIILEEDEPESETDMQLSAASPDTIIAVQR